MMKLDDPTQQGAWLDSIMAKRETRHLFVFASVLAVFTLIQGMYGFWSDSLGLISDSLQKGFHCVALYITVLGMVFSQRPATFAYSYGYDRHEVLAVFSNSLFLIFVCLFIVAGAAGRVLETADSLTTLQSARILEFGLLGLALNVGGVLTLGPGASVQEAVARFARSMQETMTGAGGASLPLPVSTGTAASSAVTQRAIYANLASHAASSLTVIVSSLLIRYQGWLWTDALASLLVAAFTLSLAVPLLRTSGLMMLQVVPPALLTSLHRARREASALDGVLDVSEEHVWAQSPGSVVGSLVVMVRADADGAGIRRRIDRLYSRIVNDLTIQLEREPAASSWAVAGRPAGAEASLAGTGSSLASAPPPIGPAATALFDGARDGSGAAASSRPSSASHSHGGTAHAHGERPSTQPPAWQQDAHQHAHGEDAGGHGHSHGTRVPSSSHGHGSPDEGTHGHSAPWQAPAAASAAAVDMDDAPAPARPSGHGGGGSEGRWDAAHGHSH